MLSTIDVIFCMTLVQYNDYFTSTVASVAAVPSTHPCVSCCLDINKLKQIHFAPLALRLAQICVGALYRICDNGADILPLILDNRWLQCLMHSLNVIFQINHSIWLFESPIYRTTWFKMANDILRHHWHFEIWLNVGLVASYDVIALGQH